MANLKGDSEYLSQKFTRNDFGKHTLIKQCIYKQLLKYKTIIKINYWNDHSIT